MSLTASPPTIQPAPQPQVTSLTGAPLVQGTAAGDQVFVAFGAAPGGPVAVWSATAPNQFVTSAANASATDLGASSDGSLFALQSRSTIEMRAADLSLTSVRASPELQLIPGRVLVPGLALHPSGALIYQPFLTDASGSAGVKGGIDILDAHSGALRLRIFLPQQFMTDVDGLHGSFLATDEYGQRLFAITSSDGTPQNAALTVVQLAAVPLGIGAITPSTVATTGGALPECHRSHHQRESCQRHTQGCQHSSRRDSQPYPRFSADRYHKSRRRNSFARCCLRRQLSGISPLFPPPDVF